VERISGDPVTREGITSLILRKLEIKMRKKQLLFVTYYDEDFGEGLPYAFNLAKMLNEGITILLIYKKKITERFENIMTAITFAEANEDKTARQLMRENIVKDEKMGSLCEKFKQEGINVDICTDKADVLSAIKDFLRQRATIDMVLLSPNVTDNGNMKARELNRLVKMMSRPIVTMARQALLANSHIIQNEQSYINRRL
jgi:hypothetical protein